MGLTWLWLLDPVVGPFDYYLRALGLPVRSLLADPHTAMWAIILTTVWWVTGYYLVIYLAGLQDIPREVYEAAALALGIFAFRSAWNDFLWPLIAVNKPNMFPLPVALALLRGAYSAESYGPIMAAATLSALPLLLVFLIANPRIVEGVRLGSVKG